MTALFWLRRGIALAFTLCYAYQFFYIPVVLFRKKRTMPPSVPHRFAALCCARNEAAVIADLVHSLHAQRCGDSQVTVFVLADNCTDDTAELARNAGAVVYTRFDPSHIGKGYALDALLGHIREDYPEGFDGYFVFDADNLLRPDYVEQMNRTFSEGHDIVTGYRNSKNFGDNWLSAGYALWFLRESRYLNHARSILGMSCAVSGTGFLFSRAVAEELGGWPFHLLTEDIEFSVFQITKGRKIAFCPDAELYDEQPTTFSQSWQQRLRWSRGYYQVISRYGGALFRGMLRGSFSCYDMTMNILPAFILSMLSVLSALAGAVCALLTGQTVGPVLLTLLSLASDAYLTLFILGAVTTVTEWKHIPAPAWKKVLYTFTFPLFMFTYLPVSCAALFCRAEWTPIRHTVSADFLRKKNGEPHVFPEKM